MRLPITVRDQHGFTLVELMIAISVTLVIVGGTFTILTTTNKSVRANDQIVDTQQNARIAMELLSRDIKVAGFGMTQQVGGCAVGGTAAVIVPADQNPAGDDAGPDRISIVVPVARLAAPAWTLRNPVGPGFGQIDVQIGAVNNMVTAGLAVGATTTAQISINGTVTVTVNAVSGDTLTLASPVPVPAAFPAGTPLYLLQCITYQIIPSPDPNNICGGTAPCLVRGITAGLDCDIPGSPCGPIVDGIEDLQFAYACDACNAAVNGGVADSVIDDQNGSGSFDASDFLSDGSWAVAPRTPATIKLVRMYVVARQQSQDQGLGEARQSGQARTDLAMSVPDHNPSDDPGFNPQTYPQFKRRVLNKTVDVRNGSL